MEIVLSGKQRLQLMNILPQESGSLRESIQVKRLRDRLNFDESERSVIEMDEANGSFNPNKLKDIEDSSFDLGSNETEIIAGSFVKLEDNEKVPTNDSFVELAMMFAEEIERFRDQLDPQDNE